MNVFVAATPARRALIVNPGVGVIVTRLHVQLSLHFNVEIDAERLCKFCKGL